MHMHIHTQHMNMHMHTDPGFVWITGTPTRHGKNHIHPLGLVFSLSLVIWFGCNRVFLDRLRRNLQGKQLLNQLPQDTPKLCVHTLGAVVP